VEVLLQGGGRWEIRDEAAAPIGGDMTPTNEGGLGGSTFSLADAPT
jgi:hypothetical protein